MRYFIGSNLATLRRNLGVYLPTALFLSAGMAVLFFVLCGVLSFYNDLEDRLKNVNGTDITIVNNWTFYHRIPSREEFFKIFNTTSKLPPPKGYFVPDEDAFLMPSDFDLIREAYGDRVSFRASIVFGHSVTVGEEQYTFKLAFLSDDFFAPFRNQVEGDVVMGSQRLLEGVAAMTTPSSDDFGKIRQFPLLFDPERGVFTDLDGHSEIRTLAFEDTQNLGDFNTLSLVPDQAVGKLRELDWDEYLFVPMKYYFDVFWPGDYMVVHMSAVDWNDLYGVLALLNRNHNGRNAYVFDKTASGFLRAVSEQADIVAIITPSALLALLVIGMNFMGLQIRFVQRKQRDFAIQIACGAGRRHIVGGALFLALLTVTSAAVIGVAAGAVAMRVLEMRLYNVFVTFKLLAVPIILAYGWLIGIASCLPTLSTLMKATPVGVLAEL